MDEHPHNGTSLASGLRMKIISDRNSIRLKRHTGARFKTKFLKRFSRWLTATALIPALLACSQFESQAQTQSGTPPATGDDWSFDVVPYLWLATYDGTFGLSGTPSGNVPIRSDSAFSTHISAAVMLSAHIRYRDVGLLIDGAWLQLKTEGGDPSGLYSGVDIKSDIAYGEIAPTYRLPNFGHLHTDLLAGARIWYVSNELDFKGGEAPSFSRDRSKVWCDPIIGASLRYDFSPHWFASVIGDAGGFGVGSDFSWNVFGGIGYSFSKVFSMTLGYRYLHFDYEKDDFKMNANVQGFLLGFGFHF